MRLPFFFLPSCAILLFGCSSSSPAVVATDAGGDAHAAEDATPEAAPAVDSSQPDHADSAPGDSAPADAPVACNSLVNTDPAVTTNQVASDPPAMTGGVIADGTYELTDATIYTGPSGPVGPGGPAQTTLQITGTTVQMAESGQPPTRTVTLVTSGTTFTATTTCPESAVSQGSYTATATTLAIEIPGGTDDAGARTVVETFTRQ
jgi:hypothetical protein